MRKSRGMLGYVLMLAAFLMLALIISDSIRIPAVRVKYPELLEHISEGRVSRVAVRGNSLYGLKSPTLISEADFPTRNDFESTIGPDFTDTLLRMYASQNKLNVDTVSVNELNFGGRPLKMGTGAQHGRAGLGGAIGAPALQRVVGRPR